MKVVEYIDWNGDTKTRSIQEHVLEALTRSNIETNISAIADVLGATIDALIQKGLLKEEDLRPEFFTLFNSEERIIDVNK
jgi:hypothetical protein